MPSKKLSLSFPTNLEAWKSLNKHYRSELKDSTLTELFKKDPKRAQKFSLESGDLFLDYSKNHINSRTFKILSQLIKQTNVPDAIESMFSGEDINITEKRPALHVGLRSKISDQVALEKEGVKDIWPTLEKMEKFVSELHEGSIRGVTNKRIKNIVNIGIGGSELGSTMAVNALRGFWQCDYSYFSVSSGDCLEIIDLLDEIDIEETIFIVCSKSFSTIETKHNADIAKKAIEDKFGIRAIKKHFAGVSSDHELMTDFGIQKDFQFFISDWVGGRFSITSAVGLPLACMIGMHNFYKFLEGARIMDLHFRQKEFEKNMPMILAALSILYSNFFDSQSQAIINYHSRLKYFSDYARQLHMESLGKSHRSDDAASKIKTGGAIWGGAGSDGQHSYFQFLHQGKYCIPIDFLLPVEMLDNEFNAYNAANCLAQSESLMDGRASEDNHRSFKGNNPSNTILIKNLTPQSLGQLVALYEHKVFAQSIILGINAFDQFGVELGKANAKLLTNTLLTSSNSSSKNRSTKNLLSEIKKINKEK